MSINEIQDQIIEEFSDFDDWMDKYQLLIDMGNDLEVLDEKYKTEQNLIDGCQSRVWVQCDHVDGRLLFQADSDALIVKGIIALLIRVINNQTAQDILDADLYFIDRIGLREHLSPTLFMCVTEFTTSCLEYSNTPSLVVIEILSFFQSVISTDPILSAEN